MLVKMKRLVVEEYEVNLKPGDEIKYSNWETGVEWVARIRKIVENRHQTYIVAGGVWLPLTTYGRTWKKVN